MLGPPMCPPAVGRLFMVAISSIRVHVTNLFVANICVHCRSVPLDTILVLSLFLRVRGVARVRL